MKLHAVAILFVFSLVLAGCGTDPIVDADADTDAGQGGNAVTQMDAGSQPVDMAPSPVDMGEGPADLGHESDAGEADADDDASAADAGNDAGGDGADAGIVCDLNGFSVTSSEVNAIATDLFLYEATEGVETDANFRAFELAIYTEYGGTAQSQSFTFTGENYADCGNCVLAYECTPTTCGTVYLVESGSVDITAAGYGQGDAFDASFTDLVLREVTIDDETLQSTIVPGGKTWCIDSLTASGTTIAN